MTDDGIGAGDQQVVAFLDDYRRAVRDVAATTPAVAVRARAERRTARRQATGAVAACAAVLAVITGATLTATHRSGPPTASAGPTGQPDPTISAPATPASPVPDTSPDPPGGPAQPCRAAALFARMGRPTTTGTEASDTIELFNTGARCTVAGHVGLQFRAPVELPTVTVRNQPGATPTIMLPAGRAATVRITWIWTDGTNQRCPAPEEVAVTLAGDPAPVTAPWTSGDAAPLCPGPVQVYPLAP